MHWYCMPALVYIGIVCRYLVLEHVSGGELFDYLVRKGRLSEREVWYSTGCVALCATLLGKRYCITTVFVCYFRQEGFSSKWCQLLTSATNTRFGMGAITPC